MREKNQNLMELLRKYWIFLFVIAQPLLDVLAYWTASESGTAAGYIRLFLMIVLFFAAAVRHKENRKMWAAYFVVAAVFGIHLLNCIRVGYLNPMRDINYMAKVVFMPITAISFAVLIESEEQRSQVFKGILVNAFVLTAVILVSYLTNHYTPTYGEDGGIGISGWVIMDNRCCHSDILSSVCVFLGYFALCSRKSWVNVLLPIGIEILLLTNGTQACYLTLFGVMLGYPVFLWIRAAICRKMPDFHQKLVSGVMLLLAVAAVVVYPYTPRYHMEEIQRSHFSDVQIVFEQQVQDLGYDVHTVTPEEILQDEDLHEAYRQYYIKFLYSEIPALAEDFDINDVFAKYDYTYDANVLGEFRTMKQVYASLLSDRCDTLTHFFGYEFATIGDNLTLDMENDWYAVFFYYGYVGFAMYVLFALYLIYRIISLLKRGFKEGLTDVNFCILMCFVLQLGLAYFSGAILRRPNSSVYLALTAALLCYQTTNHRKETIS